MHPDPRRAGLHGRVRDRARLARHAPQPDRRGYRRDHARRHRTVLRPVSEPAPAPPFTAEHERLRLEIRRFVTERLRPHADAWEAAQWFPNDVFRWVAEAGYLGL